MENTERFTGRVENYIRFRPHYPPQVVSLLDREIGLTKDWLIADIGSGTGISAELFIRNGNTVFGVEPNREMREAAEKEYRANAQFISIDARAEATSLPDNSIDMIVAGQAFHWFDKRLAKNEFTQIIKPGGYLTLMWNIKRVVSTFDKAYEQMLFDYGLGYDQMLHSKANEPAIESFFSPCVYLKASIPNKQILDFPSLQGRLLSASYAPLNPHPNHEPMLRRLREIFDQYNKDGRVVIEYDCYVFSGKIK